MNGESYRFCESMKKNTGSSSQEKTTRTTKPTDTDKAEQPPRPHMWRSHPQPVAADFPAGALPFYIPISVP